MDAIIDTAAVVAAAVALVNLFKFGFPTAPSWSLALLAVVAGIGLAILAIPAQGGLLAQQSVAQAIFQGIVAAVAAAGLDRQAVSAEDKRRASQA